MVVLNKLECPNCGSSLEQHNPNAQTIVCPACSSYVAIGGGQPEVTGKSSRIPPAPKPIKPGMTATINGTEYFVMGRVVYTGWDPAEPSERWMWNEWLLGGTDGRLLWLSYDEKGFTLYHKMRFRGQFNPRTDHALPLGENTRALIRERYPAKIDGAEGELTWRAKENEQLYVAEGAGQGKRYSIQKNERELEIHEGKAFSEVDIAQAFGDSAWVQQAEKEQKAAGGVATRALIGLVCIVFAMMAFVSGTVAAETGSVMQTESVQLSPGNNVLQIPVNISQTRRPHIVELDVTEAPAGTSNRTITMSTDIIDPTGQQRRVFSQTMALTSSGSTFSDEVEGKFVPYRSGAHQLQLNMSAASDIPMVNFAVTIRESHITSTWFNVYAVVIGLLGGYLLITGVMNTITATTKDY